MIAALRGALAWARGVYGLISAPDDGAAWLPAPVRGVARWTLVLYGELDRHQAFSKASALAYGSLVALVPLLVMVFAILQATGLLALDGGAVERVVFETFLGDIPMVRAILLPGMERANLGVVGVVGMVGWLWVGFRMYMSVEATFSEIFHVRVERSLWHRVVAFWLSLTAAPVALALVLFGAVRVARFVGWDGWDRWLGVVSPVALLTLFIKLMPATRVKWGPAIAGGLVSGLLIHVGGIGFGHYLHLFGGRDPLQILYGSLGIVPVFLFWLWLLWLFVLLGAEVAHVAQNYRSLVRAEREQQRARVEERKFPSVETALEVSAAVAWYFERGRTPVTEAILADRVRIPGKRIGLVLDVLRDGGILVPVGVDGWTLARSPASICVREIVDVWRARTLLRRRGGDPLTLHLEDALRKYLDGHLAQVADLWVEPEGVDGGATEVGPEQRRSEPMISRGASGGEPAP